MYKCCYLYNIFIYYFWLQQMKSKDSEVISSFQFEFYITFNTNVWLCSGDLHTVLRISSQQVLKVSSSSLHTQFTATSSGVQHKPVA
jgi:hypothetical protein